MLSTTQRCTSCKSVMSRTATYCTDCGTELTGDRQRAPVEHSHTRVTKLGTAIGASICFSASWVLGLLSAPESTAQSLPIIRLGLVCCAGLIVIRQRTLLREMMYEWFLSRAFLKGAFTGKTAESQAVKTSATIVAQVSLAMIYLAASSPLTRIDETLGWLFGVACLAAFLILGSLSIYNFQCVGEYAINSLLGFAACPSCGRRNVGEVSFCSGCREELDEPFRASVPS